MRLLTLLSVSILALNGPAQAQFEEFAENFGNAVVNEVSKDVRQESDKVITNDVNKNQPKRQQQKQANIDVETDSSNLDENEEEFEEWHEGEVGNAGEDITETDLFEEMRIMMGQRAHQQDTQQIKHDVTCDGGDDYVVSYMNHDNPDGPFYNVLVITRDGGELSSEFLSFSFDPTAQSALCGHDQGIETSIEHWDEGQLDATFGGWRGICTEAIRVDDKMCDAPRVFWLKGERDADQDRFMTFRN